MRRTYFVPFCVLIVFALTSGAIGFVTQGRVERQLVREENAFREMYSASSDRALFCEALDLMCERTVMNVRYVATATWVHVAFGVFFLWWGLDRRRLVRKLNEAVALKRDASEGRADAEPQRPAVE